MENDWKSRTRRVVGDEGIEAIADSSVCVLGLGGVGSSCAEALARAGIGTLALVDKDDVDPSNINRQAIAFHSTIGRPKAEVMAQMAKDINPEVNVLAQKAFVRYQSIDEIMGEFPKMDYLVDALDTLTAKAAIALYAQEHDVPLISAMGGANKTDPTQLEFADLFDTHICPLCRDLRKIARNNGIQSLRVLYSPERPRKVEAAKDAPRAEKTELGTMPYYPPIMGQMMASFVIRDILGMSL